MTVETLTLTLASSSPRRRQLLQMLGIPVQVVPPNISEVRRPVDPDQRSSLCLDGRISGARPPDI